MAILNVVVLYQIIRKLNKNNRTLNIVFKFTPSTSAMFSFSTTLLIAGKSKQENNNATFENNIIPWKKCDALLKNVMYLFASRGRVVRFQVPLSILKSMLPDNTDLLVRFFTSLIIYCTGSKTTRLRQEE